MDILLAITDLAQEFDLSVVANDLETEGGLQTAVAISLFSDKLVPAEEIPDGQTSPRGWWGDSLGEDPTYQTGSKLWLLEREKLTSDIFSRIEDYASDALAWMVADGIVASVDVSAQQDGTKEQGWIILYVTLLKPNGNAVNFKFSVLWGTQASEGF